ncbi:MAG TPA: hypothetical protein VII43_06510 [Opitutaceae bacterium]
MRTVKTANPLDRYTEIGALSAKVRIATKRIVVPLAVLLALETMYLGISGNAGVEAFAMIGIGTCIALNTWSYGAIGLPLLPMFVLQTLIIYATPIASAHESILTYPPNFVFSAGVEVLTFDLALVAFWRMGMQMFHPTKPVSYALREFNRSGMKGWTRLGSGMIFLTTAIQVMLRTPGFASLFASLPSGADSIIYAFVSVMGACGFFLVSMVVGAREASAATRISFWILLIANAIMSTSDFLLATAAANLITVAIGFFWSSGRIPWKYLTIVMIALSFLNTGKSTMRARYWESEDAAATEITLAQLPAVYVEWSQVSFDAMMENSSERKDPGISTSAAKKNQTLLDRIDNLQNLLFVIDAVQTDHISILHGQTYALIPPLLVPRVLWPDKPRSHEGQILLNVHFGRQDLASTFTTYIAWGLLPEAYGNFGPIAGSIFLGAIMGLFFAWVENLTARKLVVSMEGFLSLSLLMNLMNSFEMVASVLVTAVFQSFVIIIAASYPFVRRTVARTPDPEED